MPQSPGGRRRWQKLQKGFWLGGSQLLLRWGWVTSSVGMGCAECGGATSSPLPPEGPELVLSPLPGPCQAPQPQQGGDSQSGDSTMCCPCPQDALPRPELLVGGLS